MNYRRSKLTIAKNDWVAAIVMDGTDPHGKSWGQPIPSFPSSDLFAPILALRQPIRMDHQGHCTSPVLGSQTVMNYSLQTVI